MCCWCTALQVSESMRIPGSPPVIYSNSFPHQHADLVISGFVFCGAQCAATVCCRICRWFAPWNSDLFQTTLQASNTSPTMWPVWQLNAAMIHIYWILFHPQPKALLGKTSFVIKKGHVFNPPPCGWTALGVFGDSQQFLTLEFFVGLRPARTQKSSHLQRRLWTSREAKQQFFGSKNSKDFQRFPSPTDSNFLQFFSRWTFFLVVAKRRRVSAMRWT